jgi:hypothetical protein
MGEVKGLYQNVMPPNMPWKPIEKKTDIATMSYYVGDSKSAVIPIRDASNWKYAKRDPNIETKTYGLFSHCCEKERKAIVEQGITTQFFVTSRINARRVLTGYYKPAWYCKFGPDDYAIAANKIRFVSPGFELGMLGEYMGFPMDDFFRGRLPWRYVKEQDVIRKLLLLLDTAANETKAHLKEIKEQEETALNLRGYIYEDRRAGFSWDYGAELMKKYNVYEKTFG